MSQMISARPHWSLFIIMGGLLPYHVSASYTVYDTSRCSTKLYLKISTISWVTYTHPTHPLFNMQFTFIIFRYAKSGHHCLAGCSHSLTTYKLFRELQMEKEHVGLIMQNAGING